MAGRKVLVRITRSRNVGGTFGELSITVISTEEVEIADITAASIPLIDQADATLDGYLASRGIRPDGAGEEKRLHPADMIVVEMKEGKKYYKVKGGEFSEHGINFWPEHMKQCGINPKSIPDDGYKLKDGCRMEVEYVLGKAKRVLKLIAAQHA